MQQGVIKAVAMNGSAAIHDFELALAGKTSEDVAASLHAGKFGMARETADAFAVASRAGAENDLGLGAALGKLSRGPPLPVSDSSLVLPRIGPAFLAPSTSPWAPTSSTCTRTSRGRRWARRR